MIKLIALDIDGTLLDNKKKIPQAHIRAIHQAIEKGVRLVLCTGRPLVGIKPYFAALGLGAKNEYVILNNGCSTHQTSDWSLIDWRELSVEDIAYLYDIAQKTPAQLTLFDQEHYFVVGEKPSKLVVSDARLVFTTPTPISLEEAMSGKRIIFQGMYLASEKELDLFENNYASTLKVRFSGVRSQPVIYEVMPKGTTKATALARLAEKLAIKPEEIMALGDANNDIEMLKYAGLGIAMGNSKEHIKVVADYVTGTNDQGGVATAIEKFILS